MTMTKQRKWQIKQQKEGRCTICGRKPLRTKKHCNACRIKENKRTMIRYYQKKVAIPPSVIGGAGVEQQESPQLGGGPSKGFLTT